MWQLCYEVDEQMRAIPQYPEAHLWPREVVTLGLLHALQGAGNPAFYRWLTRDYRALFPRLPVLCESRQSTPPRHIRAYPLSARVRRGPHPGRSRYRATVAG